jgi:hypothetical protein
MPRALRFLAVLLLGLAALTAAGWVVLSRTTRGWFERDLDLRSTLAVRAAEKSLARNWGTHSPRLKETLTDITRDERIMSAGACAMDGELLSATEAHPSEFSCRALLDRAVQEGATPSAPWSTTMDLPAGPVHVSVTLLETPESSGAIVLVHDLSFLTRREATTRNILLVAFFVLSLGAPW